MNRWYVRVIYPWQGFMEKTFIGPMDREFANMRCLELAAGFPFGLLGYVWPRRALVVPEDEVPEDERDCTIP